MAFQLMSFCRCLMEYCRSSDLLRTVPLWLTLNEIKWRDSGNSFRISNIQFIYSGKIHGHADDTIVFYKSENWKKLRNEVKNITNLNLRNIHPIIGFNYQLLTINLEKMRCTKWWIKPTNKSLKYFEVWIRTNLNWW